MKSAGLMTWPAFRRLVLEELARQAAEEIPHRSRRLLVAGCGGTACGRREATLRRGVEGDPGRVGHLVVGLGRGSEHLTGADPLPEFDPDGLEVGQLMRRLR